MVLDTILTDSEGGPLKSKEHEYTWKNLFKYVQATSYSVVGLAALNGFNYFLG